LNITYVDEFTQDTANIFYRQLNRAKPDPKGSTTRILKPKPRTVNYYLRVARTFFNEQVVLNHIDRNPMITIKNLRIDKQPPEYYSQEEIKSFFAQKMHPAYRNAFLVLLHTGMRFQELATLCWDDIDTEKRLIYVRPKEGFKTKTYCSIRSIPMDESMVSLFTELSAKKQNEKNVICSVEGAILRERKLYYICNKIGKLAGVSGKISLHKFRHTFASQLAQNNVRIELIQKLLGHSSIKETMIYAHLKSDSLHDEVKILDCLFGDLSK
jgi:site-specific recombinase XerD